MSQFIQQREAFYRLAVEQGVVNEESFMKAVPLGHTVPSQKVDKWLVRLQRTPKKFAPTRRYVNRFKLGADPEFCLGTYPDFLRERESVQVSAEQLGLRQGPAFGADNNGRLVEVRPFPSRSALEVTASILSELRWMAVMHPKTREYQWLCGAYLFQDGVGGHVHFGRKRPSRGDEIRALDNLSELMNGIGIFPQKEIAQRRRGDARGQRYGQLNDFRLQMHGYEYRTWPSWLDSPELAFLTLTASKLAVHNPRLVLPWVGAMHSKAQMDRLMNLFAYYKDVDDDARLACVVVRRRLPVHLGGDFKVRWGLENMDMFHNPGVRHIPLAIEPDNRDLQEVFECLLNGSKLESRVPTPTWEHIAPPGGYELCLEKTSTYQQKGLGELIWDLCMHKSMSIAFSTGRSPTAVMVSNALYKTIPRQALRKYKGFICQSGSGYQVMIDHHLQDRHKRVVKEILTSGMLPLWRIEDCKTGCIDAWKESIKVAPKKDGLRGKVLFDSRA